MSKPSEIMATSAAFLNDTARQNFTDAAMLPYLNQALRDLEKEYELNDIPVTHQTSETIEVPAGTAGATVRIGYSNPGAKLPAALVDIKQLWESQSGQNAWVPVTMVSFLYPYDYATQIPQFLNWAWIDDEIHLVAASQDNDIRIDYIKSLFTPIVNIEADMGVKFNKCYNYLAYRTAGHCALYIGENEMRAEQLYGEANRSMIQDLGIAVKGQQAITTRRLPFRFSFKGRGYSGNGGRY